MIESYDNRLEAALDLAEAHGTSAKRWMNLQATYISLKQ